MSSAPRLVFALILLFWSLAHAEQARPAAVGDKVSVSWSGTWYPSTVVAVDEGRYRIHYEGWSNDWDEWVPPSRMRWPDQSPVGAPAFVRPPPVAETPGPASPQAPPPEKKPAPTPPPGKPTPAKVKGIAHQWTFQTLTFQNADGSMTDASRDVGGHVTFFPNGQFRQSLRIGDFTNDTHGTWKKKGDEVSMTYQWNGPQTDVLKFHLEGDRLTLIKNPAKKGQPTTWYGLQLSGSCDERGLCAQVPTRP